MTFSFVKDQEIIIDGTSYIIDKHDPGGNYVLLSADGLIAIKARREMESLFIEGRLKGRRLISEPCTPAAEINLDDLPDISGFTEQEIFCAGLKHKFIEHAIKIGPWSTSPLHIDVLSREFFAEYGKGMFYERTTLYVAWKRFTASGGNWQAQLPMRHRQGNRSPRLPGPIYEITKAMFGEHYLNASQKKVAYVIDKVEEKIHEYNMFRSPSAHIKMPSNSFFYAYKNDLNKLLVAQKRRGHMEAMREFPNGRPVPKATRALMRVEMDHARGNILLIDEDTGIEWGSPTITLAVDAANSCIVGLYISPLPPSFNAILGCLRHTCLPKSLLQPGMQGMEWPYYGIPREVVCDNGPDFHASGFPAVSMDLGCDIVYCGVGQAQHKPHVERAIGVLSEKLMNVLPGTTFSRYEDVGAYEPGKMAVITFREFVEIVIQWICTVYHQTPIKRTGTTPAERWTQTANAADIRLPTDPIIVERLLGHTGTYKLGKGPLEVDGIEYSSEVLGDFRCRYGLGMEFLVRYFDERTDHVEVIDPETRRPVRLPAVDQDYTKGLTRYMHSLAKRYRAEQFKQKKSSVTLLEARIALDEKIALARKSGKAIKKLGKEKLARGAHSSNAPDGHAKSTLTAAVPGGFVHTEGSDDKPIDFELE